MTGHGVPQLTAVHEVWKAVKDHGAKTGYYVPIIADGGIRTSGDIVKSLAAGASAVMMGSIFAGADESPGKIVLSNGKRYKQFRGMGSRSAMEERSGSRVRYSRQDSTHASEELTTEQKEKMVPEGVEGLVEYRGSVEKVMAEFLGFLPRIEVWTEAFAGGIQGGLAHSGAASIPEFQKRVTMWVQSFAGITEGTFCIGVVESH